MSLLRRLHGRWRPPARHRILVHPDRSLACVANYKCGFTAMNQALPDWDRRFHDAGTLTRLPCDVLMLVRHPVRRFQSFVHGWLIDKGPDYRDDQRRQTGNFAYRNLRSLAGDDVHDSIAAMAAEGDASAVTTRLLDQVDLEAYIRSDPHLHPQVELIRSGRALIDVAEFFELDDSAAMQRWGDRVGTTLPRVNASSRGEDTGFDQLETRMRQLYRDDFECFGQYLLP